MVCKGGSRKKDAIVPIFNFQGKGFMGIKGSVKGMIVYFIYIYSPLSLVDKRVLWEELLGWKNRMDEGE